MEKFDVYNDISKRTNGDIYIGVVGPVRVGKSTFITNFINRLVAPYVKNKHEKDRMLDELPQSAVGKTIMTTQPKFVPSEAVSVVFGDKMEAKIRLVDCVGYLIDGANGHMDGDKPRMVKTPWSSEEIPFEKAAEIGTKKVIEEHSTIGIVMTSDGSIDTQLPRSAYVSAEERVVSEIKTAQKPFVIVLNSKYPKSTETVKLATALAEKYNACVIPLDALNMSEDDIATVFEKLLMEFPLKDIEINIDKWLQALPADNEIIAEIFKTVGKTCENMQKMSDYPMLVNAEFDAEKFSSIVVSSVELGKGKVTYSITARPELFYTALSGECGMDISDDFTLMAKLKELAHAKREYDKIKSALDEVKRTGYGVVAPTVEEMTLEDPEIVKQGSHYGVKLKASAPSLHIMQVDVKAEVSPVMGAESQSEEMVKNMLAQFDGNPKGIWDTDMFGKSMHLLVNEGLNGKLTAMPEDTQKKMRRT
ncbi:MAG: stage IV sporulation protein A, partial [Clostridia bacterium]|nr:stage IV sporulation protein A [Clostridia bacterium]